VEQRELWYNFCQDTRRRTNARRPPRMGRHRIKRVLAVTLRIIAGIFIVAYLLMFAAVMTAIVWLERNDE
jgi:hypothetical protein